MVNINIAQEQPESKLFGLLKSGYFKTVFLFVLFAILVGQKGWGQITSLTSGNWSATGTWVGNVVPTGTDDVIIATGHTVQLNQNFTSNDTHSITLNGVINIVRGNTLTIGSGATIQFNSTSTTQLTYAANVTNGNQTTFAMNGNLITMNQYGIYHATSTGSIQAPALHQNVTLSTAGNYEFNGADQIANGLPATVNNLVFSGTGIKTVSQAQTAANITIGSTTGVTFSSNLITTTLLVQSDNTSSGSLIVGGTSTGNITYERWMTGKVGAVVPWHLVSAPVVGQDIWSYVTGNSIASNGSLKAITTYSESADDWNTYPSADPGIPFTNGIGYSTLRTGDGIVSFTGTVLTTDVPPANMTITRTVSTGQGWNLLGNPYPSAIRATSGGATDYLLNSTNVAILDVSYAALYLWEASSSTYQTINNSGASNPTGSLAQNYIQAGQGFFVRAKNADPWTFTFSITEAMQEHQTGTDFKSSNTPWPSIQLIAESQDIKSNTLIAFDQSMTRGLDVSYDAGMFKSNPDFSLYSKLVEDNGVDFAIQSLPEDYDELVIPIGLDAPAGIIVTFRAAVDNLPENAFCYLEDRNAGVYTRLDVEGSSYSVLLDNENTKAGTFFLHTSAKTLSIEEAEISADNLKFIVNQPEGYVKIIGKMDNGSKVRVYDLSGRLRAEKILKDKFDNLLYLPQLNRGIYLLQIQNGNELINEKISW